MYRLRNTTFSSPQFALEQNIAMARSGGADQPKDMLHWLRVSDQAGNHIQFLFSESRVHLAIRRRVQSLNTI